MKSALAVILVLHLAGLWLFKEGFLLSRLELEESSTCPVPPIGAIPPTQGCWPPKRFERVLLIVIDALRFDFMDYNTFKSDTTFYTNQMPIFQQVLDGNQSGYGLLFHGIADPPTTTLQRLMALMTGSLPTLVDAGSNFASLEIKEDSFIHHISRSGKKIVSMGDDTWDRLFPSFLNETWPFPSFDVWDLHTVDQGVISHLFPLLNRQPLDWGLAIAHFLGVDHAGHRYGPAHPAMGDKLRQMNRVLSQVFESVDDSTLVVVMGDHGMDAKGDHGGDSDNELDAGMFIYSKTRLENSEVSKQLSQSLDELSRLGLSDDRIAYWNGVRSINQIDLVSSLSVLIGLPIPFGNLGTVIPELFTLENGIVGLFQVTQFNARQIHQYLSEYSLRRSDAKTAFAESYRLFEKAETCIPEQSMDPLTDDRIMECWTFYIHFTRHALQVARNIWSRFDSGLMLMGCTILVLGLILGFVFILLQSLQGIPRFNFYRVGLAVVVGALLGCMGLVSTLVQGSDTTGMMGRTHECVFLGSLGLIVYLFWTCRQPSISMSFWNGWDVHAITGTSLFIMYMCCVASDSFTIFEDFVIHYFIQFLLLVSSLDALSAPLSYRLEYQSLVLALLFISRLIHGSTICRPDQGPFCVASFNLSAESSISAPSSLVYLGGIWIVIQVIKSKLLPKTTWNEKKLYWFDLISTFFSFTYWTLDTIEAHGHMPIGLLKVKFWVAKGFWSLGIVQGFQIFKEPKDPWVCFHILNLIHLQLSFLQKPMGGFMMGLGWCQVIILASIWRLKPRGSTGYMTSSLFLVFLWGQKLFFATGHQHALPSIQYEMGFVGLDGVNMVVSPFLIGLNTFGGPLFCGTSIPFLFIWGLNGSHSISSESFILLYHAGFSGTAITLATVFAGWFQKHSQAWRVWAPKFLLTCLGHVGVEMVALVGIVLVAFKREYRVKSE